MPETITENVGTVQQAEGEPSVLFLVGPTASGKTRVSVECAKLLSAEIINADSRQVYVGLDIGSAKPQQSELTAAPHHFISRVQLTDTYSAGTFFDEAMACIQALILQKKNVIVAGGSGLYIKVLLDGISNLPRSDEAIRAALTAEIHSNGLASLFEQLRTLDPEVAEKIDRNNPARVLRAMEIIRCSGSLVTELIKDARPGLGGRAWIAGLRWEREVLYERINRRVDEMMEAGFLEEVRKLLDSGIDPACQALNTVGYKEAIAYLTGRISGDEMILLMKQHTRNFAKRQITWFNRDARIHWYDLRSDEEMIQLHNIIVNDYAGSRHDN